MEPCRRFKEETEPADMQLRLYYLEEAFLAEDIQYCILLLSDLVSGGLQPRR